ncbi:DUF2510 domain-containing protein [Mycobacterium interjectum]|uniref:DUF2510 domain-containing protein n=1 Tax=Mycobacterium interjectum TaxID=33895 RepID=UPI00082B8D06|nr:DUF2510 domain-containing protein [Mycobacterium interjectum]MCV7089032.1 DUF2510 domain-containing protein [Mycobacterium interjectum]
MTTPPRAPDWYPDPSGKPGLGYWDGRQWHTDVPAASTPQPQRRTALITALCAAVTVLLGIIGVTSYLLLTRSHPSQTPGAQPVPAPAVPPAQGAPPPGQSPPPAPTSSATPTSEYFATPSGKVCQVTVQQVTCQTCVPGQVITNAYTCADPAPAIAVDTQGNVDKHPPDMASPNGAQQLSGTYRTNGWTIVTSGGWARFINDTTGHGMAMAAQNFDSF